MGRQTLHIDIAIIGGGIAGLWTLNQLRSRGYSAVLFEQAALGSCQTIGSQGMIHGGVKYALAGSWGSGSRAVAAMPGTWRKCLEGKGEVDLRGCKVLSEDFFLFSNGDLQSRLSSFFASKLLRGHIRKVAPPDYPVPLQSSRFRGQVYRLADLVLDVPSLLATLAKQHRDAIFSIDWQRASLHREAGRAELVLPECNVVPERLLLTAGAGNEALMAELGSTLPAMQRRPLQQVLVRHEYQQPLYGHCLGTSASPRLTISSHRDQAGRPVWYLGGELATGAGEEEPGQLINRARSELTGLLPWIDFGTTEWATVQLERAEPLQSTTLRPDQAFVGRVEGIENALVAWPTKLTLTPDLANAVERELRQENVSPRHPQQLSVLENLARPPVATAYWDSLLP
jgi:glycine/D-amino acid oxidase-like deaminating enzyme